MKIEWSYQDDSVIVGTGTLACCCAKWIRDRTKGKLFVFESGQSAGSVMKKTLSVLPDTIYDTVGADIEKRILSLYPKLILSIGNSYIFPSKIIDRCPIFNYHNALLPHHPGRNAEAWTIYEQDATTGVTWHLINERVDKGSIIQQRSFSLDNTITSIKLLQKQSKLAFGLFQEIFQQIYENGCIETYPQKSFTGIKQHYSWERPNDGLLDITWPAEKISAFLRAMDYGKLSRLGSPRLVYKGRILCWQRYNIKQMNSQPEGIKLEGSTLCISKSKHVIQLLGIKDVEGKGD